MEVILKGSNDHPSCPHGPCLMFERKSDKSTKTGKKFFACSACRDRSVCNFFHWVDDSLPSKKKEHWKKIIESNKPPFSHVECMQRLTSFKRLQINKRSYCKTCSLLILSHFEKHKDHERVDNLDLKQLLQPSTLFQTLKNNKAEAQYFFSNKTVEFIVSMLKKLDFSKVLLIGAPKIHEYLVSSSENHRIESFLMDLDHRYMQFLDPDQFCHYNLFNGHFFDGETSKKKLEDFLVEKKAEKVAVLIDPPFGGLIDAISFTLANISKEWQVVNGKESSEQLPLLWFFPYFLEPRIVKNMPEMVMMDYKVEYLNHTKFGSKAGPKGSPVRIFTNIKSFSFVLSEDEGYRFCGKCQRYVAQENQHCSKCNACTTKHGNTYKHCDNCQRCVKSSHVHCGVHNKCVPSNLSTQQKGNNACKCGKNQSDDDNSDKCFKCFGYGHKKRECTVNIRPNQMKKRKAKK